MGGSRAAAAAPAAPDRPAAERPPRRPGGILWVLRNRASWRDMPTRFGNDNTAYKRYRLWSDIGLWERLLHALHNGPEHEAADVLL